MFERCFGCMGEKHNSPVCELCGYHEQNENLPYQLPVGTILRGQYLVGRVLGVGGYGITYIGWDLNLEIPIAVKEYCPSDIASRDCKYSLQMTNTGSGTDEIYQKNRENFLREARTIASLRDIPGIVRVQNFFKDNNTAYIVMEYVSGSDLRQHMKTRNKRMELKEILEILFPVMQTLEQIHEKGIVHRDISPDNIMLQPNGKTKLLDFGAVLDAGDMIERGVAITEEAIAKAGFTPLEQYQKAGVLGPWTDIYSLCATIYYCLTGRVPKNATERLMGDPDLHWDQIPGLNQKQAEILTRGMAVQPEDRIQSVRELMEELYAIPQQEKPEKEQDAADASESEQRETVVSGKRDTPRRPRKTAAWLGVIAVICAMAVAAWKTDLLSFRKPEEPVTISAAAETEATAATEVTEVTEATEAPPPQETRQTEEEQQDPNVQKLFEKDLGFSAKQIPPIQLRDTSSSLHSIKQLDKALDNCISLTAQITVTKGSPKEFRVYLQDRGGWYCAGKIPANGEDEVIGSLSFKKPVSFNAFVILPPEGDYDTVFKYKLVQADIKGRAVTMTETGDTVVLSADQLEIFIKNDTEVTITVFGLDLLDEYPSLIKAKKGTEEYSWGVYMTSGKNYLTIRSDCPVPVPQWKKEPVTKWSAMEHTAVLGELGFGVKSHAIKKMTPKVTHTDSTITWKFTLDRNHPFDFISGTSIEVHWIDHPNDVNQLLYYYGP